MKSAPWRTSPEDPADEIRLLRAAQGGDHAAFGMLVRRYQRAVYRLAYGLTRNAADADDVAQESFVRAFQAIGRFRVGEPLYPWLSRITTNVAFSLFRRRRRRPETSIEPLVEAGHQWAVEDDPAGRAIEREGGERLAAAFATLSEEHQAILVLRVTEELSYEDIARTLSVPVGTVMSRLSRARAELRRRLVADGGET